MICLGTVALLSLSICTWLPSEVMCIHAFFLQAVMMVWCGTRAQQQSGACGATQELDCDDYSQTKCLSPAPLTILLTTVKGSSVSLPCFLYLFCEERSMEYLSHFQLSSTGSRKYAQLSHEAPSPL